MFWCARIPTSDTAPRYATRLTKGHRKLQKRQQRSGSIQKHISQPTLIPHTLFPTIKTCAGSTASTTIVCMVPSAIRNSPAIPTKDKTNISGTGLPSVGGERMKRISTRASASCISTEGTRAALLNRASARSASPGWTQVQARARARRWEALQGFETRCGQWHSNQKL